MLGPAGLGHVEPLHRLSFHQERLWFLHRLEPDSVAYNMPFLVRADGPLLRHAVQASLDEIVRRHQALRTRFLEVDGRPVQVVEPAHRVALQVADVSELPSEHREEEAMRLARADVLQPFDLTQAGLMRALLVKLDEHVHHLLFTFHHIVADSAAAGVLLRELVALYPAMARGAEATLPELPAQYTDYVAWQRDPLRQTAIDRHLDYWRSRLSGGPDWLDLPVDRRPRSAPSPRGGSRPLILSREATDSLRTVARGERTTLFVALLAALQVLLHRYSRQTDIVVGIPVSDRRRVQFEPLVGFFVNTVAIRTRVHGHLPFRQLLREVRETVLDALSHQDAPFERVVEVVRPARTGRNPLFQVLFSFDEFSEPEVVVNGDLRLRVLPFESDHAMVDLSVCALAGSDGIYGHVEFAGDLFDADTIDRLIGHLETLVGGIVADPDSRVAELPLLTTAEQEQLRRWNATAREVPATRGMHRLFEAQARRTPHRTALVAGDREVTYETLDQAANRLASLLASRGVRRGSFVGISATRSTEMVAGLLAVHKAGGAYVGLDPELGEARVRFALEDLDVRVVLADPRLASVLPEEVEVVPLAAAGEGETASERSPGVQVSDEDLAAAIYTSGSTGVPKAVGIRHGSAVSFLHWAAARFLPGELRGVLATTSPVFDCTLFEVFTPLSWGGTVVLADSVLDLPTLSARDRVTLVSTVPSTMEELLRQGGLPAGVMTVNLAGDVLAGRLVTDIQGASQVRRIFNHYGPSEATTYATGALISDRPHHAGSVEAEAADPVPTIGWPIANVEAYVADEYLNLLPVGVPGELFIGGAGLACGYIGRPALTAELFIADPWSGREGARVYRTGDLVRYRRDGSLDFLGRRDRQVKLRGYRIELGEVEAVLEAHPGVQRAVTVVHDGPEAQRQLVAYYVPAAGCEAPTPAQLVARARARLPRYMVPAAAVPLESFPLTANGKVDRKALPPPGWAAGKLVGAEPAGTVVEAILAGIWCDLLELDRVGLGQDFFDLGGNSLRMVALASRLEELLGVRVLLSDLLTVSTVRDLASLVSEARPNPVLARVGSTGEDPPLFLAYPGGASFFGLWPLAARLGRAVVGLLPLGLLGGLCPRTVEDMAEQYLQAVLSVQASGPYLVAGLGPGGALAYELSRRLTERGERVLLLGLVAAAFPNEGGDEGSAAERPEAIERRFGIDGVPLRAEERLRLAGLWRQYRAAWARYRPQPYTGPVAWVGSRDAAASRWSQLLPQLQVVPQGHVDVDGADDRAFDALATLVGKAEAAAAPRPGGVVR
jgi:amino acid adenylation domain-containing protein